MEPGTPDNGESPNKQLPNSSSTVETQGGRGSHRQTQGSHRQAVPRNLSQANQPILHRGHNIFVRFGPIVNPPPQILPTPPRPPTLHAHNRLIHTAHADVTERRIRRNLPTHTGSKEIFPHTKRFISHLRVRGWVDAEPRKRSGTQGSGVTTGAAPTRPTSAC